MIFFFLENKVCIDQLFAIHIIVSPVLLERTVLIRCIWHEGYTVSFLCNS